MAKKEAFGSKKAKPFAKKGGAKAAVKKSDKKTSAKKKAK